MPEPVAPSPNPEDLMTRVVALIADTQEIPAERITPEADFEEIGLTSLNALSIAFEIEHEFGVTISEEDAFAMRNIRQVVDMLSRLLAGKAGPLTAIASA